MADQGKETHKTAISVAIITALGGALIAYINGCFSRPAPSPAKAPPTPIVFVGRVSSDTGSPILGAIVLATADQTVGQPIRADSNGQFQINLPEDTQALRLTIDAPGYAEEKIQANVHRTGPEEIYLHPHTLVQVPSRSNPKATPPSPPTREQNPILTTPIQTVPNGINIGGDNNGTATVNNFGPAQIPPLTPAESAAITSAVKSYSGQTVSIEWETGNAGIRQFVFALKAALESGGITVQSDSAVMNMMPNEERINGGISFLIGDAGGSLAQAIAASLVNNGYPQKQFHSWSGGPKVTLFIYVGLP